MIDQRPITVGDEALGGTSGLTSDSNDQLGGTENEYPVVEWPDFIEEEKTKLQEIKRGYSPELDLLANSLGYLFERIPEIAGISPEKITALRYFLGDLHNLQTAYEGELQTRKHPEVFEIAENLMHQITETDILEILCDLCRKYPEQPIGDTVHDFHGFNTLRSLGLYYSSIVRDEPNIRPYFTRIASPTSWGENVLRDTEETERVVYTRRLKLSRFLFETLASYSSREGLSRTFLPKLRTPELFKQGNIWEEMVDQVTALQSEQLWSDLARFDRSRELTQVGPNVFRRAELTLDQALKYAGDINETVDEERIQYYDSVMDKQCIFYALIDLLAENNPFADIRDTLMAQSKIIRSEESLKAIELFFLRCSMYYLAKNQIYHDFGGYCYQVEFPNEAVTYADGKNNTEPNALINMIGYNYLKLCERYGIPDYLNRYGVEVNEESLYSLQITLVQNILFILGHYYDGGDLSNIALRQRDVEDGRNPYNHLRRAINW